MRSQFESEMNFDIFFKIFIFYMKGVQMFTGSAFTLNVSHANKTHFQAKNIYMGEDLADVKHRKPDLFKV